MSDLMGVYNRAPVEVARGEGCWLEAADGTRFLDCVAGIATNSLGHCHPGLIAALTAALLDLPVDSWPVLGGMGNASWAQLSGHGPVDARLPELRWRLDVWNASAQVANDVL